MPLDEGRQQLHVSGPNQTNATQCAAVAIPVGTGIKMDTEMTTSRWEQRFDPDPDRTQLSRIVRSQWFHWPEAVLPDRQGSTGACAVSIRCLTMRPAGNGIELT